MNSKIISKENQLNQMKSKIDFKNLKSDYILKKVFELMKKNKILKIMKYNINLQKRLNLSINNYKKYAQFYSSIEIELNLNEYDRKNRFINISGKEKKYYHIYFDNSNEEIKRNYLEEKEKINKIKIIIEYKVKSLKELFAECEYISLINFKKFYRININNMKYMFYGCSSLKELNLSNFNTKNVSDMSYMFYGCSS